MVLTTSHWDYSWEGVSAEPPQSQETCRYAGFSGRYINLVSRRVNMTAIVKSRLAGVSERLLVAAALLFFGSFMIFGVGLAADPRMHNAAHDTRHSIGFPCH
jgi:cobalt transporter subunit CbtB